MVKLWRGRGVEAVYSRYVGPEVVRVPEDAVDVRAGQELQGEVGVGAGEARADDAVVGSARMRSAMPPETNETPHEMLRL
jgi:hypothetical protein